MSSAAKGSVFLVMLSQVKVLQSREKNDDELIEEYVAAIENGATFPPGSVILDPETGILYLVDGIHRALACDKAGEEGFPVTITIGTEVEALLASSGANASHGKKRSNKDKEHAVMLVLRHPELCRFSNNYIAKVAQVSPQLVDKVREMLEQDPDNPIRATGSRLVQRNGKTFTVSVAKKAAEGEKSDKADENTEDNKGETPKETPQTDIPKIVKRIVSGIEKAAKNLPSELQQPFSKEMLRALDVYFGTETMKS